MARETAVLRPRLWLPLAFVALLCLVAAAPVAADTKSGKQGHYQVTDRASHPGATCNYTSAYPNHYLVSIAVRAPRVWWPNTTSASNTEHGNVAWWPIIQRQSGGGWHTVKTGTHQQAVAYEDHPRNDAADSAHFTSQTVAWSASGPELYRVVVEVVWLKPDSSILGQVKHVGKYYAEKYPGYSSGVSSGCSGRLTILT